MALILDALVEILHKPTMADVILELAAFAAPLCLAVLAGILLGWVWRPRRALEMLSQTTAHMHASSPQPCSNPISPIVDIIQTETQPILKSAKKIPVNEDGLAITKEDLEHLCRLVEEKDGGPAWNKIMEKSLPMMRYQAWHRDLKNGLPEYRSSTIFEDASPETVRDFFWDDEFRMKNGWDDMLLHHETLEECPMTGTMVVHWIRKFPFFCSDRDYIIGRRIWVSGRTYYCVTMGVPNSVPRRNKPRRVDLYYSSWCIRPVESRRGNGDMTACEVLLFHHEDMGIPSNIVKFGIRQGMWNCVQRIEPGLRAYQITRATDEPISRHAKMASINTKFNAEEISMEEETSSSTDIIEPEKPKHWTGNIPKFLVVGGAVALACTLDRGLVTKAVIFGVARRFPGLGKR